MTFALLLLGMAHVTRHEKDGKGYVERVPESEQGFKHHTEGEDMVVRQPFFASLATALSYSSISLQTSWVSGYMLALYLRFCSCVSLQALSSSISSHIF